MKEIEAKNKNYCLEFNDKKYNNYLFKLILIGEVKRFSNKNYISIQEYYKNISIDELKLQLICVDATLSKGTLALAEKYMIKNDLSKEEKKERLNKLASNYIPYLYSKNIYNKLLAVCKSIDGLDLLIKFKELAENGYYEH